MWAASVFHLYPDMFPGPLGASMAGTALANGLWALKAIDIRDHGLGRHRAVDDTPAGGGPGMVCAPTYWPRAWTRPWLLTTRALVF